MTSPPLDDFTKSNYPDSTLSKVYLLHSRYRKIKQASCRLKERYVAVISKVLCCD